MDLVGESKIQLGAILPGDYAVFTIPHMSEAISLFWSSVFSYREENNLFFDVKNQFLSVIKTN
jgi:DNA gyrase inhibitor GyrI